MSDQPEADAPIVPLPMFPLGTVLFPHVYLPLHVFEPRYRALVKDCLRVGKEFGVVLIERGHEVGGGDARFRTGTVARIVEAAEYPDGRWAVAAVGGRRIKVSTWLPDDPYPVALVGDLDDTGDDEIDEDLFTEAERAVRRALALKTELGEPAPPATVTLSDERRVATWQLAAVAPLSPFDQQQVLERDHAAERLRLLAELATEVSDMLAYRLSGG
ncbi:MAG TPA: LON peptidase substrate-binding domain-containing protein [Acidimicrobiales bacterium]|nr:LON peptidase substrate-binding domain-containing protein [Acidimicrobiales bacterium]